MFKSSYIDCESVLSGVELPASLGRPGVIAALPALTDPGR
jgi:hypothetical protein